MPRQEENSGDAVVKLAGIDDAVVVGEEKKRSVDGERARSASSRRREVARRKAE